jgi:hypothetical protein
MQKPNMGIDTLYDLAVELEHQTQHAVRGRVLGPEIDRKVAEVLFGHGRGSTLGSRQ